MSQHVRSVYCNLISVKVRKPLFIRCIPALIHGNREVRKESKKFEPFVNKYLPEISNILMVGNL